MREGLTNCRDVEIANHERYLYDLGAPQRWQEQTGLGLRVNYQGRVGFAWFEGNPSVQDMLQQAIINASEGPEGDFGQRRAVPRPVTAPSPPDLEAALAKLTNLVSDLHFYLPSFISERSFTINAQIVRDILTLTNRTGSKRGERLAYLLCLRSPQSPPISAYCYATALPASPDHLLTHLAWCHQNSLQVAWPDDDELPALLSPRAAGQLISDLVKDSLCEPESAPQYGPVSEALPSFSPLLTLYDDGTQPRGLGTVPFDGEGLPHQRVELLKNGQACHRLRSTLGARARRGEPLGTSIRLWGEAPCPGYSNLLVAAGSKPPSALCRQMNEGLWIEHLTPLPGPAYGGVFRRRANVAFLVREGKPIARLPQLVVEGHFADLLGEGLSEVGGNPTWQGRTRVPSLLIKGLRLSEQDIAPQEAGADAPELWW